MSVPARSLVLFSVLVLCASAMAQPYKYGCHYFREHPHAPTVREVLAYKVTASFMNETSR